jgi:two-component system sensor kinase FixL
VATDPDPWPAGGELCGPAECFRLLLDGVGDVAFSTLDASGRITTWQGSLGRDDVDPVGQPLRSLYTLEDLDAGRPELDLAAAVRAGRVERDGWRVAPGGRRFWARAVLSVVGDGHGNVHGFALVLRDMSEHSRAEQALQESEARYRAISELTSDYAYAFSIDRSGRVTVDWVAGAFTRITGYAHEEMRELEASGGGGFSLVHPDDRPAALARVQRLVLGEPDTTEFRIVTKSGDVRWIRESGRTERDEPNGVTRVYAAAQDITERKLAEEEARARQAELAHVLRLGTMGEMAAGLAHEINQPLSAIVSYARGCTRRLKSGMAAAGALLEPIEEIAAQAMRADEIVQRLLLFVRKQKPARELERIDVLVREVVQLVAGEARKRGVRIVLDLAADLPRVLVDRIQIEQVVLNLVRNGIEAMQTSADDRVLQIETRAADDGAVEVAVRDSGEGLTPELADRVFEPFFTTKRAGLGMGLAISRSIVRAHGGRISASRNPDRGATFRFTLPAAQGG